MPIPRAWIEKGKPKYGVKYCRKMKEAFPELDISACEAAMGRIFEERWAPGLEAGLRAFFKRIGALH